MKQRTGPCDTFRTCSRVWYDSHQELKEYTIRRSRKLSNTSWPSGQLPTPGSGQPHAPRISSFRPVTRCTRRWAWGVSQEDLGERRFLWNWPKNSTWTFCSRTTCRASPSRSWWKSCTSTPAWPRNFLLKGPPHSGRSTRWLSVFLTCLMENSFTGLRTICSWRRHPSRSGLSSPLCFMPRPGR